MAQQAMFPGTALQEGIVVWDQRGVVVRWANGESSRFSWETLRQVSRCDACREQRRPDKAVVQRPIPSAISPTL
jgi:hypothetical protein